jgi:predicted outer membrane protein
MCLTRTCVVAGALATIAPTWALAQRTLPSEAKVEPGSPEGGFTPTAYAEPLAEFHHDVRELDAAHVKMAEVAERKASPRVQDFAKQVRLQFSGGPSSLKGASNDQGVPIVGTVPLNREHQTLVDQLQAGGADVDRLFVDYEILVLKDSLGLVEIYATGGTDSRLRRAAAEAVSTQKVLLETARTLQKP